VASPRHAVGIGVLIAAASIGTVAVALPRPGLPEHSTSADTTVIGWNHNGEAAALTGRKWADLPLLNESCTNLAARDCWIRMEPDGLVAITVSGTFAGAPVELRLDSNPEYAGRDLFHPGVATFRPTGNRFESFSFTFVHPNPAAQPCDGYRLQWRSPTGGKVRFTGGSLVAHYKTKPVSPTGRCA
jgi:hypothetical protein